MCAAIMDIYCAYDITKLLEHVKDPIWLVRSKLLIFLRFCIVCTGICQWPIWCNQGYLFCLGYRCRIYSGIYTGP